MTIMDQSNTRRRRTIGRELDGWWPRLRRTARQERRQVRLEIRRGEP